MRSPHAGRSATILAALFAVEIAISGSLRGATPDEPAGPPTPPETISAASEKARDSAAATAESPDAKPRYRLVYRFQPGQVLRYEVRHRSSMEVRKGEAPRNGAPRGELRPVVQTVRDQTITEKHVRVVSVAEDGSALLEPVIDRVRMEVRFDDADPIVFDSDDPGAAPRQFQDVHRTVGKITAHMRVAPHGALLDVIRLDAEGKPREGDEGEPAVRADENILALLPEAPVGVGDVWKERYPVQVKVDRNIERTATLQREFQLLKMEGSVATIGVRIAIITPIADPAILAQLIQRTPAGTVRFDIERGEIVSRALEHDETIFGAIGPTSALRATSKLVERQLSPEQTARAADPPRS
ncbi:MAG: hypothetical protein WED34_13785 [Planctomycetales bacterium]